MTTHYRFRRSAVKVQLSRMHKHYEEAFMHTCGMCCNLFYINSERLAKQQYRCKCKRYDDSDNVMTDWKTSWTACRAYNQPMTKAVRPIT